MLTTDMIDDLAVKHLGNPGIDPENFARAIEAEVRKEQAEKIAELTRQLEAARKNSKQPKIDKARSNRQTEHELEAMKRYIEKITKDKDSAVGFLSRAGIIDGSGQLAEQYRNVEAAIKAKDQQ